MPEIGRGERAGLSGGRLMLAHADAQVSFTQPARAAVNEHQELSFSQPAAVEFPGGENFLDGLQFGEMVADADHAESGALPGGFLWLPTGAQTAYARQRLRTVSPEAQSRPSGRCPP